jgi:hypothetical protein
MRIYKKLLQLRKPNTFGIRLPLSFRHNTTVPFPFGKDELSLLYVWNIICLHVHLNRKKPRHLDDDVVCDLLTYNLTPDMFGLHRSNLWRNLKKLEEYQLLIKLDKVYIVSPWYCNVLSQHVKEYIIEQLHAEVQAEQLP